MRTKSRLLKLSTFWLGPLLAGVCLGIGHGTTQRIWIMYEESRLKTAVLLTQPKSSQGFNSKEKAPLIKTHQNTDKRKEKFEAKNQSKRMKDKEKEIHDLFQTLPEPL